MKELIMKDFKVLKFMNLWMLFMGILFGFIGTTSTIPFNSIVYGYGIFVMTYMFSIFTLQIEERSKSYIMVISLPTNRERIVLAKYISTMIYLLFSVIFVLLIAMISIVLFPSSLMENTPSIFNISLIIGLCLIFLSIYLPFQYYNVGKVQAFNQVFYIFLILLPNIIPRFASKIESTNIFQKSINMNFKSVTFIILGIGILLYLISLNLSQKIYKAKEFY